MSDEPKKLIEAHLEAHAAQRRLAAGGRFELGEPARSQLLAEVQRVHGLVDVAAPVTTPVFQPLLPQQKHVAPEPVAEVTEQAQPTPQPVVANVVMQTSAPEVAPAVETPAAEEPVVLKQSVPAESRKPVEPAEEFSGPSAWSMLWRRLALSFGAVAMVGIAAFVVRMQIPPDRGDGSMAKLSPMAADKAAEGLLLAEASESKAGASEPSSAVHRLMAANEVPAPVAAPASSADRELVRREAPLPEQRTKEDTLGRMPGANAAASAPAPMPTAGKKMATGETHSAQDLAKAERKSAPAKPATSAPVLAVGRATASAPPLTIAEGTFVQREVQSGLRRNLLSPPKPEVLTSFRIVPQGDSIQIIDADGSIYIGKSSATNSGTRFTASGTNVVLGQLVTIEAASVPPPKAAGGSESRSGEMDSVTKAKAANAEPRRGILLRGRISISAGSSWEFEAQNR